MTQKLVEMQEMFGSLFQPIPIFDIAYAVTNMIVYEGGLPPVKLGGWSSLFLFLLLFFGRAVDNSDTLLIARNLQTKILMEDYFPDSSFDRPTDQGCAGLGPCFNNY